MRIINRERGTGKSSMLVSTAYTTGLPIIVANYRFRESIYETARKMGINKEDINVYTIAEVSNGVKPINKENGILIDDAEVMMERIFSAYFRCDIAAATMTV